MNTRFMCLLDLFQKVGKVVKIACTFSETVIVRFKYRKVR